MGWTGALFWLLPRRLRSSWPLLAITSFGILAAVTMMALGAVYSNTLAEGGLRHSLASSSKRILNVQLITQNRPLGSADYTSLRSTVEGFAQDRVGYMQRQTERYGQLAGVVRMIGAPSDDSPPASSPIARPFFYTNLQEHSRIVEGRWPEPAPLAKDEAAEFEVVIGGRAALQMGYSVGSQLLAFPFSTDPSERVTLTIVGHAEPLDANEEYWINSPGHYFSIREQGDELHVPLYVLEEDFFGVMGTSYPSLVGDFTWFFFLDADILTSATAGQAKEDLIGLETDVNQHYPRTLVFTGLKNAIDRYRQELTLARVPLYLFISLIVLVILYFLALVVSMLSRARMDEASIMRSRGAGIGQVSGLLIIGEGVVALLAMVVGPVLAWLLVRFLLLETINPAGEASQPIPVGLSLNVFVMGIIGGALSLLVLGASSISRARMGMVESLRERARPPTLPLLQRYYLDLLVLAAVVFILWEIQGREGFVISDLASQTPRVDLVLLFGPVLVLIGAAVVVLRMLPLLVRVMSWLADRMAPAWVAFPLARLAREPLPHGSLVIILMLAAALGVFGAAFQSTLSLSQKEQALYKAGGDFVVKGPGLSDRDARKLEAERVVRSFTPVLRENGVLHDVLPREPITMLAVDPDTLPDAAWFRDDFAGKSLPELLRALRSDPFLSTGGNVDASLGIAVPPDTTALGIWVEVTGLKQDVLFPGFNLWARMYDPAGRFHNIFLGEVNYSSSGNRQMSGDGGAEQPQQDWIYLEAEAPEVSMPQSEVFRLVSLFFSRKSFSSMPPATIGLDDITAKTPSGPPEGTIVEGFESPANWVPLVNEGDTVDIIELTEGAARTGELGLKFGWEGAFGEDVRGIIIPAGPFPIPAIGGPFLETGQRMRVRAGRNLLPVIIRDTTDFFPTLDPTSRTFVILSLEHYRDYSRRISRSSFQDVEEYWLAGYPGTGRAETQKALEDLFGPYVRIQDREGEVETAQRNPLAGGGWDGLTILGMAAIIIAVLLALVIHAVVAVRTSRVDLTVARTLGFSNAQLMLSLALERLFVAVLGLAVGSVIGIWLGRWVLGFLDITGRGRTVIPPQTLSIQEWLVASVLGGLIIASLLGLIVAAVSAQRLRVTENLRAGE